MIQNVCENLYLYFCYLFITEITKSNMMIILFNFQAMCFLITFVSFIRVAMVIAALAPHPEDYMYEITRFMTMVGRAFFGIILYLHTTYNMLNT